MHRTRFAALGVIGLLFLAGCGGSPPEEAPAVDAAADNPMSRFAGAWSLVSTERRDADGALIGEPISDRLGYIMYDATGYMGVTLMRPDPRLVAAAVDVSRRTFRKIRQNLFWAFIYNVIGLPLAASGFLSPPLAALAMALSSVSVVCNSLVLRTWRPGLEDISREHS